MGFASDPTVDWLLEPGDPAVRAQGLVALRGATEDALEVADARQAAMETGPIAEILAHQQEHGGWQGDAEYYARGTMACLPQLAQLGADPGDERIRRASERLLSLIPDDGFFRTGCGQPNVLWALARFGYEGDARFKRGCDAIVERYRLEDGTRAGRLRWQRGTCFGKHPCFMAIVPMVLLCTELRGSPGHAWAEDVLTESVEFLLRHHLYLSTRKGKPIRKDWTDFAFPSLACDTDCLDLLSAVCGAGYEDDPRVIPAVQLVLSKRQQDGRWLLDRSYSPADGGTPMRAKTVGNYPVTVFADLGRRGEPSKWVTLKALTALAGVPEEFAEADPPPLADGCRRLSRQRAKLRPETEDRLREFMLSIGAAPFIDATLDVGERLGLLPTWDRAERYLFLGPEWLPEWMAVRPVIIGGTWEKARETKSGWLWRVMFMVRKGALTESAVLDMLGVPPAPPKGKKKRIRFGNWERDYLEISVDLYSLDEMRNLESLAREALATLSPGDTCEP